MDKYCSQNIIQSILNFSDGISKWYVNSCVWHPEVISLESERVYTATTGDY